MSVSRSSAIVATVVLAALGTARADVKPVPGLVVAPCAAGFYFTAAPLIPHQCRTPPIKCPPHPTNWYTAPLQTDTTEAGHRFRYQCPFSAGAGLQCATGFSPIPVTGTQYECRTAFIKCPPRANVPSFTQVMPTRKIKNGAITFEYQCRYH